MRRGDRPRRVPATASRAPAAGRHGRGHWRPGGRAGALLRGTGHDAHARPAAGGAAHRPGEGHCGSWRLGCRLQEDGLAPSIPGVMMSAGLTCFLLQGAATDRERKDMVAAACPHTPLSLLSPVLDFQDSYPRGRIWLPCCDADRVWRGCRGGSRRATGTGWSMCGRRSTPSAGSTPCPRASCPCCRTSAAPTASTSRTLWSAGAA